MQIAGSSAIVVGGAGGLGEATVRRLHARGREGRRRRPRRRQGQGARERAGRALRGTDATSEESVNAAIAEAVALAPLRISVDTHGGPASGGRLIGKDGSPLDLDGLQEDHRVLPDRGVQRHAAVRRRDRQVRAARGGRPRRHRQHRLDRRLRGPDRPAPVRRRQGRRGRHDAGRRPRPVAAGHPRRAPSRPAPSTPPPTARPAISSSSTGARRCRSPSGWAGPPSTPNSLRASSRTTTSTARSSASTARSGSRPSDGAGGTEREGRVRRRGQPGHRRDDRAWRSPRPGRRSRSPPAPSRRAGCPARSDSVADGITACGRPSAAGPLRRHQ